MPQNLGQVLIGDQAVSGMCNVSPGLYQHLCRRGEQGIAVSQDVIPVPLLKGVAELMASANAL